MPSLRPVRCRSADSRPRYGRAASASTGVMLSQAAYAPIRSWSDASSRMPTSPSFDKRACRGTATGTKDHRARRRRASSGPIFESLSQQLRPQ